MPRGIPLTPQQIQQAVEVYTQTGNYSEAGRAIGVPPNTARVALLRHGEADRCQLHALATARGIRKARRGLDKGLSLLDRLLDAEAADGPGLEPRDIAALLNARARLTEVLLNVAEREDRRKQSRLTRAKTQAETRVLEAKAKGLLPEVHVDVESAEVDRLLSRYFHADPAPRGGGGEVVEPLPPVPAPVDH
jgi:hypothetical protein